MKQQNTPSMKARFILADRNQDDVITYREFARLGRNAKSVDANADKRISLEEFIDATKRNIQRQARALFVSMDKNENGRVSFDEFRLRQTY